MIYLKLIITLIWSNMMVDEIQWDWLLGCQPEFLGSWVIASNGKGDLVKAHKIVWYDLLRTQTVGQRTNYDIAYMQNLKNDTNKLIYKVEIELQFYTTILWLLGEREWGINWKIGIDIYTQIYIKYKINRGPTVYHREFYSILCNDLCGNRI